MPVDPPASLHPPVSPWIADASEADFDTSVVGRSHVLPVLLDIGAEWCGPCRVLTPMLERLARDYDGSFVLVRVDADENMRIAGRHKVRGFPTVVAYSRGAETERFHGAQPERVLRAFIERLIAQHAQAAASLPAGATGESAFARPVGE